MAGARTITSANAVLDEFVERFNARFAVPARQADQAYRVLEPELDLAAVLCFKHSRRVGRDNTVKYKWKTVQLLPGLDRLTYAGATVEVLEHPDGQLRVRHEGKVIPIQLAAPRPGALRAAGGMLAPTPDLGRTEKILADTALSRDQLLSLARLEPAEPADGNGIRHEQLDKRKPTRRQLALWKPVQHAKLQGHSLLRAIARQLGVSRNTIRKYTHALTPPMNRLPDRIQVASIRE